MRFPFGALRRKTGCSFPSQPILRPLRLEGSVWCAVAGLILSFNWAAAADFTITSPGFFYSINGVANNPVLTVVRGELYTFAVSTALSHPFRILGSDGVTNNNISSGTISWRVPTNEVDYSYECSIHHFGAQILTVAPPTVSILELKVATDLTLKSTGASNYSVIPEFKTDIAGTNWFALTVQTNRFLSGTNETICGRPPDNNVFIRIKSQRQ